MYGRESELHHTSHWKINNPGLLQGSQAEVKRLDRRFRFPWQNGKTAAVSSRQRWLVSHCWFISTSLLSSSARRPPKRPTLWKMETLCKYFCRKCFKRWLKIFSWIPVQLMFMWINLYMSSSVCAVSVWLCVCVPAHAFHWGLLTYSFCIPSCEVSCSNHNKTLHACGIFSCV